MSDRTLTIDQVLTRLTEHPKRLDALTSELSRARLHRPAARGEWSLNDVLAHLRSCADVWGTYIVTIIAEDRPTIRAVNPTTWIESTNYPEMEFAPSLRTFMTQRAELLARLRVLPRASWARSATVTGAGAPRERTVLDYARRLATHERSHLKHVERIAASTRTRRSD